jgi:competence protein ComEA
VIEEEQEMNRVRRTAGCACALTGLALLLCSPSTSSAAPARAAKAAPAVATQEAPVDVNTASEQQLMAVPGIGASLAKRIVQFRDQNGRFDKVDDLLKVQGVGEKSIEKLRPYLTAAKAH